MAATPTVTILMPYIIEQQSCGELLVILIHCFPLEKISSDASFFKTKETLRAFDENTAMWFFGILSSMQIAGVWLFSALFQIRQQNVFRNGLL